MAHAPLRLLGRRALLPAAAALTSGLYAGRVFCEVLPGARFWYEFVLLALLGLLLGAALVFLVQRLRLTLWFLLPLAAYAFWPWANERLALAAAVIALNVLLFNYSVRPTGSTINENAAPITPQAACNTSDHSSRIASPNASPHGLRITHCDWAADACVFLSGLGLYVATLAPSVQPADAGEFQLVASTLGIAHPPGYPLYTLLGRLFTLLPLADAAWRVNLFAAVCAAATLGVLCRAVRESTGSGIAGFVAACALGLTPTFWAQGTFANIRSLTALLTALALLFLLRWGQTRSGRHLFGFAVVFGLGAGHHPSILMLALPFLAYVATVEARLFLQPRRWLAPALGFGATLLVIGYLPLRSSMRPAFDTPSVRTLGGLLAHVLSQGFRGDFLYFLSQPNFGQRLGVLLDILNLEFGLPLWLGGLALGLWGAWQHWRRALLWGGVVVVNAFAAITYRAPQTVEYLLPAYVALALALGLGLGELKVRWRVHPAPALVTGVALWLALSNGLGAYPSFRALHRDNTTRQQAEELLQQAPPQALILANWHQATPLWYLQLVEGRRPDVQVTYVYPEGSTPNSAVWVRRIAEALATRPVIVTNRYAGFATLPYRFQPLAEAWLVLAEAATSSPSNLDGAPETLGERFTLLGYTVSADKAAAGKEVVVRLAWKALQPLDRDYSWSVQLLGAGGVAGQADLTYTSERVAQGEVIVEDYHFTLRPDVQPGAYRLVAGVYFSTAEGGWERLRTADGRDAVELGLVQVGLRTEPPPTAYPLQIDWSDGSRLVGVDWDDSVAGQRRLYLHWQRPVGSLALDLDLQVEDQVLGQVHLNACSTAGYQTVSCDLPEGVAGVRLLARAAGQVVRPLSAWGLPLQSSLALPNATPGTRYLDFGGELVLVGARWQEQEPAAGAGLLAGLTFVAARPLTHDYSISLDFAGADWRVQDDGTPAFGAIPTLKWLAGWRVRDPRWLLVPAEAQGEARLGLAVYDAFTMESLSIGDDRLVRAGQGTRVVLWRGSLAPGR